MMRLLHQKKLTSLFANFNSLIQLPYCLCSTTTLFQAQAQGQNQRTSKVHFASEADRHEKTFMCWPGSTKVWGSKKLLNAVQRDVAGIAKAIANFEPVTLIVSPKDHDAVKEIVTSNIDLLTIPVNDVWARDTLPVFTIRDNGQGQRTVVGVNFNFNGWGQKANYYDLDSALTQKLLYKLKIQSENSTLTTEGGALETDGAGTLLATESSLINKNRNPGKSKAEIEQELKRVLGIKKIIWFKGVKDKDITDAHVDCIVRFVRPGRVVITRPCPGFEGGEEDYIWKKAAEEAYDILRNETDADGRQFEIVELFEPNPNKIKIEGDPDSFVSTYVNYYVVNGGVIMPKFGDDEADLAAQKLLGEEYPGREIVAVEISALASGGGGIHCATHDVPSLT